MQKNKLILLALTAILILPVMSGCKKKEQIVEKPSSADVVEKPNVIDTNSLFMWSDVEDRFKEAENEAYKRYQNLDSDELKERTALVKELAEYLPKFEDGGDIYELEDALTVYRDALELTFISTDISDVYCQIGTLARDGILSFYGGYTEEVDGITLITDCEYLIGSIEY